MPTSKTIRRMSLRDRLPYAEHIDRLPDGTALFAIQNLSAQDMANLAELVRCRRAVDAMHILGSGHLLSPQQLTELRERVERLDNLHEVLKYGAQGW
jgi:hypothetical protein